METSERLEIIGEVIKENAEIRGHLKKFSDGRAVFIGKHPEEDDSWCLSFKNEEEDCTRIKLSEEAMAALVELYGRGEGGTDTFPLTFKISFEVREEGEAH